MADSIPRSYSTDPTLYLYTSLTAGSSHIITATSRLETILKSNKIPFQALDVATDEKARMLWGRRAGKRKLPGLVRMGMIVGDLEQIEDWNEYGELKDNIGNVPSSSGTPSASAHPTPGGTPSKAPLATGQVDKPKLNTEEAASQSRPQTTPKSTEEPKAHNEDAASPLTEAMRRAGKEAAKEAAKKAGEKRKPKVDTASNDEIRKATSEVGKSLDHAAVLPAPSGTAGADSAQAGNVEAQDSSNVSKPTASSNVQSDPMSSHRGSNVSTASAEMIQKIEQSSAIPEEPEEEAQATAGTTSEQKATASSVDRPGHEQASESKTQSQPAASGDFAGASVGD